MNTTIGALDSRRKTIILISCCLSLLIVSMDSTIVNVAIPSIRRDLGASAAQMQWVVDVYTLVLASLLMLSGAAGDRFGRRRVFQIGLLELVVVRQAGRVFGRPVLREAAVLDVGEHRFHPVQMLPRRRD